MVGVTQVSTFQPIALADHNGNALDVGASPGTTRAQPLYVAMVDGDGFVFDSAGILTGNKVSSFVYATRVDSSGAALNVGATPGPTKFGGFVYVCRVGYDGTVADLGASPGTTKVSGFKYVCLVDTSGVVLGTFGGASAAIITAPVLTRTSGAGAAPLTWTTAIDATVYAGYFWRLQVDQTSNAFGALTQDITQMITPSEIAALDGSFPTFSTPPFGLYYMRIRVEREDGQVSAWSNVLTDTIVPVLPRTGAIKLWLEAADLATMFQNTNGTTAANTDGDPVGYWGDKSGNTNHMLALANDTTRPTHKNTAGVRRVAFDGTNDLLSLAASLGIFAAGNCTVMIVLNTPSGKQGTLFGEGNSASFNPAYNLVRNSGTDFKDPIAQIKNDAGTVVGPSNTYCNDALTVNTDVVLIVTDDGSNILGYRNNVAGASQGYSRTGTYNTFNRTFLGGDARNSAPSGWQQMDVYAIVAWTGVHTTQERADANNYGSYLLTKAGA